jgi:hypothetical protein
MLRRLLFSPWPWAVAVALLALAPWCRNHTYLRDFYDYGLVIAANARIEAGERPYVDFTTPIQSGLFWANIAAERLGRGDYLSMTRGAALFIGLAAIGLTLLLARLWPRWLAALAAAAVVLGSASQHTIIWHNSLGVACLALVAWSTAVAPMLRRRQWGWHVLTLIGLVIGGLNKLNFHLVAIAAALGWLVRAWVMRDGSARRSVVTAATWCIAALMVPIGLELLWTGASLPLWIYNVVNLASGARAEGLMRLFTSDFYVRPMHDYYGELALPSVGAVGLLMCVAVGALCWRAVRSAEERILAVAGTGLAFVAGAALTATNFEIAYVGLAAWAVLAIALALGFQVEFRGWVGTCLAVPLAILLVFAGESAWRGQRSQFGHADHPRAAYLDAADAGAAFRYLRGVRVPPPWVDSLRSIAATLPPVGNDGTHAVFYGPGLEWLERPFPAKKHARLPLWVHWGTSYSDREFDQLGRLLGPAVAFDLVLTPVAWDYWDYSLREIVELSYARRMAGPLVVAREPHRVRTLFPDAIQLLELWGGNTAVTAWDSRTKTPSAHTGSDGRVWLGRSEGEAALEFTLPVRRIAGEVVVQRLSGNEPVLAEFTLRLAGESVERWWLDVALGARETMQSAVYQVDCEDRPFELHVRIPPAHAGKVFAGFRGPRILHAAPDDSPPPRLRPGDSHEVTIEPREIVTFLPDSAAQLRSVVMRGGAISDAGVVLSAGGELWLQFDRPVTLTGAAVGEVDEGAVSLPAVRAGWYKGGRFEIMTQSGLDRAIASTPFRLWSPEPDGWMVFTVDRLIYPGRVALRIEQITPEP